MTTVLDEREAALERENAELRRQLEQRSAELREALDQQTATAEVLQVINSSPGDLAPVFDAMLDKALRLCEASYGHVVTFDGEYIHIRALTGDPRLVNHFRNMGPVRPPPESVVERLLRGENVVHIADMAADAGSRVSGSLLHALSEIGGTRSLLGVALRKDDALIGAVVVYRQELRPFSDKQIALLQNFAAQAVIAMENARLITETREALEQQTATAEVLQVINSSPGDLAPVFDAMVERAARLCEADEAALRTFDGELLHLVAVCGSTPDVIARLQQLGPTRAFGLYEPFARGDRVVHIADVRTTDIFRDDPVVRERLELRGIRTWLAVALHKEGVLLGVINVHRHTLRPFSDKQIALLQNFAAQAVIAMENARLITETREALEQQTATAEVLQVINSSPGDLAPVFDAILEKARALCGIAFGSLQLYEGGGFRAVAVRAETDSFAQVLRQPIEALPGSPPSRLLAGERFVQIADVVELAKNRPVDPRAQAAAAHGVRTLLFVPLRKDADLLGYIAAFRKELQPFTDKEIALLQNFAAQAVIAMENARLITETREALEQQTATAEVLQVINSSPGDLAPVFDAILEKAHSLCGVAKGSLELYDGQNFRAVATRGLADSFADELRQGYPASANPATRPLIEGQAFTHILDRARHKFPFTPRAVDAEGAHTLLCVPLRRDDKLLGMIAAARLEVRPFTDKQIALLQSFAAQAVVAMDNARLLDEIRQRQAELRVTFDNMGDGVAMFDGELRLAAWNRNFQQILGLPDEFIAGRPSAAEFVRHLATHGEFGVVEVEAEVRRLTETLGAQWSTERTRPDGRVIEVRHNPVPGGGFVLIYSDITERQRAEAQIRAARDAAEKALGELKTAQASLIHAEKMASLGQLTAGIAHEIKNPLNFVNNFAGLSVELLDELKAAAAPAIDTFDDVARAEIDEIVEMLTGNLKKIAEHGRRADGIVKSMLDHSRGTSGERQTVDINAVVEEALNLAYHGARAQDQDFNVALERDLEPDIAPIVLMPQDLTRVFLNLFGNAFYAVDKRRREAADAAFRPMLKVATRDLGGEVEIRVRDNGAGIAPEVRDKLFQPFFTTKPTGEGTGLGLSISWDIVTQQHGGTIEVDSSLGEFTEFTIRLPRRAAAGALPVAAVGVPGG